MPPTDTTRTSVSLQRPPNESRSRSVRQGHADGPPVTPGGIFLLNFQSPHRESRALTLRAQGHKVFVPEESGTALKALQGEDLRQADILICDLTRIDSAVWADLRRICNLRRTDGMLLMVGCESQIYRGAEFELLVEKQLGARLVYAK